MNDQRRPKFTYLGHATVRCDLPDGEVVLIDPWVGQNPSCPPDQQHFERLDAMLLTHGHSDHIADALELARAHEPLVVANFEICTWMGSKGIAHCSPMNIGGSQSVLGMNVSMVRADHSCGIQDGDRLIYGGTASGFVVRMPSGYTFYHAGDTALFSDMQLICEMYRPELAFLPIGDLFTMDPQQAARACRYLGVRHVIPIHWGTFPALTGTPQQLEEAVGDLGINCQVIRLDPGQAY